MTTFFNVYDHNMVLHPRSSKNVLQIYENLVLSTRERYVGYLCDDSAIISLKGTDYIVVNRERKWIQNFTGSVYRKMPTLMTKHEMGRVTVKWILRRITFRLLWRRNVDETSRRWSRMSGFRTVFNYRISRITLITVQVKQKDLERAPRHPRWADLSWWTFKQCNK